MVKAWEMNIMLKDSAPGVGGSHRPDSPAILQSCRVTCPPKGFGVAIPAGLQWGHRLPWKEVGEGPCIQREEVTKLNTLQPLWGQ